MLVLLQVMRTDHCHRDRGVVHVHGEVCCDGWGSLPVPVSSSGVPWSGAGRFWWMTRYVRPPDWMA